MGWHTPASVHYGTAETDPPAAGHSRLRLPAPPKTLREQAAAAEHVGQQNAPTNLAVSLLKVVRRLAAVLRAVRVDQQRCPLMSCVRRDG